MSRRTRGGSFAARLLPVAFALVATGCRFESVPPPEPLATALAREPGLHDENGAPLPYRLAVAPVHALPRSGSGASLDATKHVGEPEPVAIRRELVEALGHAGVFKSVTAPGLADDGATQVADAAWAEGDDLILDLEVRGYDDEYFGHSNYVGWFLAYAAAIWPAWYVPVDYYGVGIDVHATVRNVAGGEPILDASYSVKPTECVQELTPDDRELAGFLDLGALWSVEGSLQEANWRAIDRNVAPHAWRRIHLALIRDLAAALARPLKDTPALREKVLSKVRKRFAVVVGVSKYADSAVPVAPSAAADARAFADLLESPAGGGLLAGKSLLVLTDEAASKSAVLEAVAAVASRATPSDEVILYFAGLGATVEDANAPGPGGAVLELGVARGVVGDPVLLTSDTRSSDVAGSALPIAELARALTAAATRRIVVFLDTSFAGQGRGSRTFDLGHGARPRESSLVSPFRGAAVVLASRPEQPARCLSENESSIFAYVLRQGLTGALERDGEGRIALPRLVAYVHDEVRSRAGLEGWKQEPISSLAQGAALAWPR